MLAVILLAATQPPPPLLHCAIDLVLLLDASCSINKNDTNGWTDEADFVGKLTDSLDISLDMAHVGIIEFAEKVTDNIQLSGSRAAVNTAVGALVPPGKQTMGCRTYTGTALNHAHKMMQTNGRSNVSQVVLMVTDGIPQPDTQEQVANYEANAIKEDGITIVGVGVGIEVNPDEIKGLCSSPSDYFPVTAWDKLEEELIKIVNATCRKPQLYECVDSACVPSTSSSGVTKVACDASCGPPPPPKCDAAIDLVLALDSSCSIDNSSWFKEVEFAQKVVDQLNIDSTHVNLGVVEFAKEVTANVKVTGDLSAIQDIVDLLPGQGPQTMGCETHTGGAFDTANKLLANGRKVPKVLLMVTDGAPVGPGDAKGIASKAADATKAAGVKVLAAGVGPKLKEHGDEKFLKSLVTSSSDYFAIASWDALDKQLKEIIAATCPPPPPPIALPLWKD